MPGEKNSRYILHNTRTPLLYLRMRKANRTAARFVHCVPVCIFVYLLRDNRLGIMVIYILSRLAKGAAAVPYEGE